jgi:hypothetical protein
MDNRYIPAKLFFVLATVCVAIGAALFRPEWPLDMDLNPIVLIFTPRLIPFAVAIISAAFGLVFLAIERNFKWPVSVPLTLVQIAFFLGGVFGHTVLTRFWWRVLGEEHATNLQLPLWSVMLYLFAFTISVVVFFLNIFLGSRTLSRKA